MAKWYVYKSKLNESGTFFYKFLCELKYNILIEKTIAIKNDTLQKYINKWEMIDRELT